MDVEVLGQEIADEIMEAGLDDRLGTPGLVQVWKAIIAEITSTMILNALVQDGTVTPSNPGELDLERSG